MLTRHGIKNLLFDASIEGMHHLLNLDMPPEMAGNIWTRRAFANCSRNISSMRDPLLYANPDRYRRAVRDLGRVLSVVPPAGISVGLADYSDQGLAPARSADLLHAAEHPERNPFYSWFSVRLRELFDTQNPSMAGISLNYLSQALTAFSIMGFIRREYPKVRIALGGGLVTSWTRNRRWTDPFRGLADHIISGPGELPLLSLLDINPTERQIPCPDYSSLPLDQYLSPGFILPYSASSGCYWNRCSFCPEEAEGNCYEPVPAGQAVRDIKHLVSTTGPSLIHLLDNAVSPALLDLLCRERVGVPWYGFARINNQLADPDFCSELKRSGCAMLKLGIESGDQKVLDALDKGMPLDTAARALKNLKKAGIATYVYLLFGTPPETEQSARKTLEFTAAHSESIDFLNLAIFNMPICSIDSGLSKKTFSEGDLSLYTDFSHPHGWDRKKVRTFLDREFRKNRAIASILKRDVPVFTSNHAPFFVR